MTENKRFVNIGHEIHLNGEWWCSAGGEHCADVIATAINEIMEENEQLKEENQRMTNKLNEIALELVDNGISQGKATEISEMSYREFLDYRAKNNKPMELRK